MSKPRDFKDERLDEEFEDLDGDGIDVPRRMQTSWRRSDGLRRMPSERDWRDVASKPHRVRRQPG